MSFWKNIRRIFRRNLNQRQRNELGNFLDSMAQKAKETHFIYKCEQEKKKVYFTQGIIFIKSLIEKGKVEFTCKYTDNKESTYYNFTTVVFNRFFPELNFLLKYNNEQLENYCKENRETIVKVGDKILHFASIAWHYYDTGGWENYEPLIYE